MSSKLNRIHSSAHLTRQIFLPPGGVHFDHQPIQIRTVLGSCVAMVFWHPRRSIGGMCHFMLPRRTTQDGKELNGLYADEAIELTALALERYHTHWSEYQVRLYGGGNMFPILNGGSTMHIGRKNAAAARKIVNNLGLSCIFEDLEDTGSRSIALDVENGSVTVTHQKIKPIPPSPPTGRLWR